MLYSEITAAVAPTGWVCYHAKRDEDGVTLYFIREDGHPISVRGINYEDAITKLLTEDTPATLESFGVAVDRLVRVLNKLIPEDDL